MAKTKTIDFTNEQIDQLDLIDDTIYNLCSSIVNQKDEVIRQNAADLFCVFSPDNVPSDKWIDNIISITKNVINDYKNEFAYNGNDFELTWDKVYIGEIADLISDEMFQFGYNVYYPYSTQDINSDDVVCDFLGEDY